jgi:hypothetical protein
MKAVVNSLFLFLTTCCRRQVRFLSRARVVKGPVHTVTPAALHVRWGYPDVK